MDDGRKSTGPNMFVDTPLISVIICTRNRQQLVARAIESVMAQEAVKLEVIVVDDHSTDDTVSLLSDRFGDSIRLVCLPSNVKVAAATNLGFEASTGSLIALLGDDDHWTDVRKLAKQVELFKDVGERLGVVGTWWSEESASGSIVRRQPDEPVDWAARVLEGGSLICGSTALVSREAWIEVGGLDERMPRGTDSDLFRGVILSGYRGAILMDDTTMVDVGHGLGRMTTRRGWAEAKRIAWVHAYTIWKYRAEFVRRPRILSGRLRKLIILPIRAVVK